MEEFAKYVVDEITGAVSELIVSVGNDNVDIGNQGKFLVFAFVSVV